jgi:hypothetical protein
MPSFSLSPSEENALRLWVSGHKPVCPVILKKTRKGKTVWDLRLSYEFTPTGIGNSIVVCCLFCGTRHEVTDYSCW